MNPLKELQGHGQSVWLDYLRRSLITSGELQALIAEDGLRGMTSNPSIFEKAIGGSTDYDDAIKKIVQEQDQDAQEIYERLAIEDIRMAADILRPVYEATETRDGYISIEVSPYIANDTGATVREALRLWRAIGRDNLMIKVPATQAGLPAIAQLTSEGINVNITLLFSRDVYDAVAAAYLTGLEALVAKGGNARKIASVASFFVSRVDTAVDDLIEKRLSQTRGDVEIAMLTRLIGRVAIANAKLAYQRYERIFQGERWEKLQQAGAQTQRLLWASTGTKNPRYRDVRYVEELIGPDTVNTIPPATMDAFRHHGQPRASLEEDIEAAQEAMITLDRLGISLEDVSEKLLSGGLRLFSNASDKLLAAVKRKRAAALMNRLDREATTLGAALVNAVKGSLDNWQKEDKARRLWRRDSTLWTDANENEWLGWLDIADDCRAHLATLDSLAREVKREEITGLLLLGMGGSSLGPEVLGKTLGSAPGFPVLHVLDSTDPAQIRAVEKKIDIAHTLFIVSSKSGTTIEPNIFKQYFFARAVQEVGQDDAGKRFIAITDPGSPLEQQAQRDGFRHVYAGLPSVGGRYSVLSNFGMVPAAAIGIDIARLLENAETMANACASSVPPADNPGVTLGLIIGTAAREGRDKLTIVASPVISSFGGWLEQLVAESTGKNGRGIIPVDGEPLGQPDAYGNDRLFVYLRLNDGADGQQDKAIETLARAGHPVVRIAVADAYHVGQEFFRWEMAVAVAGSILGVNPFDQPDVEASKVKTRELTDAYERLGELPSETPIFSAGDVKLFADPGNARALTDGGERSLAGYLRMHLGRIGAGDYCALLAYIERNETHHEALQAIRRIVRDAKHAATCLGFGPRFLHSTGQAYKGGPDTGVFLQITCEDANDLSVPGQKYSFGVVKAAQARGDFAVLAERGRRALRIHLTSDVAAGLATLEAAVRNALA